MRAWNERPIEIANLFNPAFCGEIIRNCVKSYEELSIEPMPFSLLFLILPIILHKKTRCSITSHTRQFHPLLDKHQDLKLDFSYRASQLIPITREAITFLLQVKAIRIDENAQVSIIPYKSKSIEDRENGEIDDCFKKARILGRLFGRSGNPSTIYAIWGVRP